MVSAVFHSPLAASAELQAQKQAREKPSALGAVTPLAALSSAPTKAPFDWGGFFGTTYWVDPKENVVALLYTQKVPNSYGDLSDKFKVLVYQAITQMNDPER